MFHILNYFDYSRLFWVYHQKQRKTDWKLTNKTESYLKLKQYNLKLLIPEMAKLLGSTENKIAYDKNG